MIAVARSAQTKRTTSRIRYAHGWRSGEEPRTRLSSSSARRSDCAESTERRGFARRGVRSEGWPSDASFSLCSRHDCGVRAG